MSRAKSDIENDGIRTTPGEMTSLFASDSLPPTTYTPRKAEHLNAPTKLAPKSGFSILRRRTDSLKKSAKQIGIASCQISADTTNSVVVWDPKPAAPQVTKRRRVGEGRAIAIEIQKAENPTAKLTETGGGLSSACSS
jgi:hypothetical protein